MYKTIKPALTILLFVFSALSSYSQLCTYSLSGQITDAQNNYQPVVSQVVTISTALGTETVLTNPNGVYQYSITTPCDSNYMWFIVQTESTCGEFFLDYVYVTANQPVTHPLVFCTCTANAVLSLSGYTLNFSSTGSNNYGQQPSSVLWDFGNGYSTNNYPTGGTYTYPTIGLYTVCVTLTYPTGCVKTDCENIQVVTPTINYCGVSDYYLNPLDTAGGANTVDCGTAYLISLSDSSIADSTTITPNGFCFSALMNNYTVLVVPCETLANAYDLMPTYYSGTIYWQNADVLPNPSNGTNVGFGFYMVNGQNLQGPGQINGTILWGDDKAPGDPVTNTDVLLLDNNAEPIGFVITDESGYFSFDNLPYGTYQIYPEYPGYTTYPIYVTISAETPTVSNVNFSLGFGSFVGIEESQINITGLYPNPAQDVTILSLASKESGNAKINVVDITGKNIQTLNAKIVKGQQNISLNLQNMTAGIYTITLTLNGEQYHTKLIKR